MLNQACGADDSDFGSPKGNHALGTESNLCVDSQTRRDSNIPFNDQVDVQKKTNLGEMSASGQLTGSEPQRSMGEILSSMDHEIPQSISGPESSGEKATGKLSASSANVKKSTFWGRNNVSCLLFLIFDVLMSFIGSSAQNVCVSFGYKVLFLFLHYQKTSFLFSTIVLPSWLRLEKLYILVLSPFY